MHNPPIRTITLGIAEAHPLTPAAGKQAALMLQDACMRYAEVGVTQGIKWPKGR